MGLCCRRSRTSAESLPRDTRRPGYEKVAALAFGHNHRPPAWFLEEHAEFSPPLLILGTFYEIEATGEWEARVGARARFATELTRHKLPLPPDSVRAELDGWLDLTPALAVLQLDAPAG
jgi:hypothetical protein